MEKIEFEQLNKILGNLEKHVSTIGKTNTGKTTLMKLLHENTKKVSIFFNTQDEDVIGHKTRSWDYHLLNDYNKINFIPDWEPDKASFQLKKIVTDLSNITLQMKDRSRKTRFIIFVDESHEIAKQGVNNTPLHFIFKRGKRYGITGVSITQRPAELDKGIVTQADYHVIFDVNNFEDQYFKAKDIPINQVKDQLFDSHNFTIYDNRNFLGVFEMDL